MPTINRPKKLKLAVTPKSKEIAKLYNSTRWHNLRKAQLMQQPLCEMCQQKGIVTLATEVHHIRPISTEYRPDDLRRLALDPYNLMSLCRKCHEEIHRQLRKKGL